MHNDIETYAFIVASLLSDYGYLVLNPKTPSARNHDMIEQAGVRLVFTSCIEDSKELAENSELVLLSTIPEAIPNFELSEPNDDSMAYILFTSGSTGKPKGVQISKANLKALHESFFGIPIEILASDHVLQMFDLTFDGSVLMLFMPLSRGASIYTTDPRKIKYMDIARLLTKYPLSFIFLVPSVISMLKPYLQELCFPTVRTLLVGAEATTKSLLDAIRPVVPNAEIWNLYGPTEATVCVLSYKIDDNVDIQLYNDMIPIGRLMPNVTACLVDDDVLVQQINQKGELHVSTPQLSKGYIGNQKAKKSSFKILTTDGEEKLFYATGDIVFKNEYGNYVFCGRIDNQVKIQGYRIELSEIECLASRFTGVSCIAGVIDTFNGPQLYLYIQNPNVNVEEISEKLQLAIPSYMVPKIILPISVLPQTPSNKIDRVKLKEMALSTL